MRERIPRPRTVFGRNAIAFPLLLLLGVSACEKESEEGPPPFAQLPQAGVSHMAVPAGLPPVLVGAGDIGSCWSRGDEATAKLLDQIPGVIFTAGDNVYPSGTADQFRRCFQPSWGRHRARMFPAMGDHEVISGGLSYFTYFGNRAGARGSGYYSIDVGGWHIVIVNTNLLTTPESPQGRWLIRDLRAHATRCAAAIMHYPRFTSGPHGEMPQLVPLWRILYDHGVDLVLSGHDHHYERFARQTADARRDDLRGVRQFIVGTGGKSLRTPRRAAPNSEVRSGAGYGLLKLTLAPDRYAWEFLPVVKGRVSDSGVEVCR